MESLTNDIMVSIWCLVYNHEPYLRQCLEGFVMQKTNFRFEAIVHDDVSTDKSADIIREYAAKYPNIIKPIIEVENQYSKNDGSLMRIFYKNMRGRYIAICEGDDYWTDPYKLQKQFDIMECHPEVDMCAHSAYFEDALTSERVGGKCLSNNECVLKTEDAIIGEGSFLTTNTLFYRRSIDNQTPSFRKFMDYDYTIILHGAMRGGVIYLPDYMSVYHIGVPGSFCNRKKEKTEIQKYIDDKKKMLLMFDADTNYRFHDAVQARFMLYDVLSENGPIENIKALYKFRQGFKYLSMGNKLDVLIKCLFPRIIRLYHKIKAVN